MAEHATRTTQYTTRIIDADGHVMENQPGAVDWEALLPERFKARAPRYVDFDTGGGRLFMEGQFWSMPYPRPKRVEGKDFVEHFAARSGMWDPKARLADLALDGIDIAVLFGGPVCVGVSALADPEYAAAIARAYNTWLAEFCSADPGRLKGVAAVPLQDPEAAAAELEHTVKEHGFVAAVVPPHLRGKTLDHRDFYPLYAKAEALDVPVCVHMLTRLPGVPGAGSERFDGFFYTHATGHPFEQMIAVMTVVCGGVLDAFPRLRFAFLEGWSGWLPFWIDRLDHHFRFAGHQVRCRRPPGAYIRSEQCFFSCEGEESTLDYVAARVGPERLLYASDYWHIDARFPGTVAEIRERAGLSAEAKALILGGNAARLFRL